MVCKKSPKEMKSLKPSFVLFEPKIVIVLYTSFQHPATFQLWKESKTSLKGKALLPNSRQLPKISLTYIPFLNLE